ncbi:hypothetical protein BLNAU_24506 [Blattamonas nauphoetae]|uniref:Uncharacterized protein n=1 Tax=Blattamonas nauphoetae TaxID=2049346 RepID=A0ABQ9WM93_9EUKA|nr:hypothetical protein BLNAU_24506 [Blattamonas nauphoetae]
MLSIDKYINAPEQYTESYEYAYLAGSVQTSTLSQLEKASARFSSYIEEWIKSRNNPDMFWKGVLTAILQCLTNSWAISDLSYRRIWKNIKPHWSTFVIDFEPFPMKPKSYRQGINSREQCLHWILVKFHKAATTLLKQGVAPKLLTHMDQTESDHFLFSDLKILFVCLRMRRVRVLHFHHPFLEEGLEDAAEMVSFHNNETIADYAKEILILRPIGSKLIPLMKFRSEYWPNVSRRFKEFRSIKMNSDDDGCSSDAEYPIDVEKAAEKRARRTRYRKTSSSEHEYNEDDEYENDDEQYDEEEEAYEGEEEEESRSDASDEYEDSSDLPPDTFLSEREYDDDEEQYDEEDEQYGEENEQYGEENEQYGEENEQYGEENEQYGEENEQYGEENEQYGEENEQYGEENEDSNS